MPLWSCVTSSIAQVTFYRQTVGQSWPTLSQSWLVPLALYQRWLDTICWRMDYVKMRFYFRSPCVKQMGYFDEHLLWGKSPMR